MTREEWLDAALADAKRRGLPDLGPMLEMLAGAARLLRAADFADDASGGSEDRSLSHRPEPE